MRVCLPEPFGRGAGLGNELFPWSKAFMASQELGVPFWQPAWGLNSREYWRDFDTSQLDWVAHRLSRKILPVVRFDEEAYLATGRVDFGEAIAVFARQHLEARSNYILSVGGMWGGFRSIERARPFVLSRLLSARNAKENLYQVQKQVDQNQLLVAVHIRRGDFSSEKNDATQYQGVFNVALPLEWYMETCGELKKRFQNRIRFVLLTDAQPEEVKPFLEVFDPITTFHLNGTACSDLLMLASADLLVCSVSSYSMWGAFLSGKPYLWFANNLQTHQAHVSIWGHESGQQKEHSSTRVSLEVALSNAFWEPGKNYRGVPVKSAGEMPMGLFDSLENDLLLKNPNRDLIQYGVAPKTWK